MRITLVAVGRARSDATAALYCDFAKRLRWPIRLHEVEARLVALDERGQSLDSSAFAALLGRWQDEGLGDLAFVIGGAEGLSPTVLERADLTLSLGPMTWPHLLARVLLAEQLFRAQCILDGHPYHRG